MALAAPCAAPCAALRPRRTARCGAPARGVVTAARDAPLRSRAPPQRLPPPPPPQLPPLRAFGAAALLAALAYSGVAHAADAGFAVGGLGGAGGDGAGFAAGSDDDYVYTTRDVAVDLASPLVAYRVASLAFNQEVPLWLDAIIAVAALGAAYVVFTGVDSLDKYLV
jgi:hypothetical protein